MELTTQLMNLKKKTMRKIAEAAGAHDTKRVTSYSALANRIEDDERTLANVMRRISGYEKEIADPTNASSLREILDEITSEKSATRKIRSSAGKEEGFIARETFLDAGVDRGYRLTRLGKTVCETNKGHKVAIPFANEQRPDRWFLGISDEKYDVIVLLCQEKDGDLFDFIVPRDFLEKFWKAFSRSGGQVKLNVSRHGKNWHLIVPGYEPQAIGSFLRNYGPLRTE